jgi:hypothetical protein
MLSIYRQDHMAGYEADFIDAFALLIVDDFK